MEKPKFIITTVAPIDADWGLPEEPTEFNDFGGSLGYVNVSVKMELTGSGDFSEYVNDGGIDLRKLQKAIMMGDIELKGYNNI